jgi:outer membrane protein assembly factor BamA
MFRKIALCIVLSAGFLFPEIIAAEQNGGEKKKKKEINMPQEHEKKTGADGGLINGRKKWGIIPFGFPYYSPDTSGAAAFALVFYYNPDPADPSRKPDELSLGGTYTLRNQMALKLENTTYFNKDDYKLIASVAGANYPQYFWGVGPDTREYMKEKYIPVSFDGQPGFLFKAVKNLYIGPLFHFSYVETWRKKKFKQLILDLIPGSDGTTASGIGANITFDNRDSTFYPHRGYYLDARVLVYRREFGSEYNFTRLEIDFRPYVQLYQELVLAFQLSARMNWGTVPFMLMPQIGGMERMRGYADGRYMDKDCIIAQAEFRFPIVWRFGGVLFGSAGTVAPRLDKIDPKYFRYAWGPGLRFTVEKEEHINFRFDVGFDEWFNPSYYFFIKEAF